ncbi:MAG: MFS transporter [Roseiflexaceae bacterium]|nr:MFS transporter [Roseiflexaceae bacterium]
MTTLIKSAGVIAADPLTNGQLALVTIARLALTIAFRIIYPLQPFLAGHLHVDLVTVSALVTIQLLASLFSPLGGTLADTRGERTTMSAGLALFCIGALLCALVNNFAGFLAGYALIGLGITLYQPAATAYLSARTPYARRGWALGIFETSWAGAALIGVAPLMLLVQTTNSSAPVYWVLLIAGILSLALIHFFLPPTPRQAQPSRKGVSIDWRALRNSSVVAVFAMMTLTMFAYDLYGVVQGAWLKQDFRATEALLGQTAAIAGAAELCGSLAVILLVDRIGKKRSAIGGFICAALCIAALPFSNGNWWLFLGLLFLFFLAEEFAIVAAIPLISGVAPTMRGTVLAMTMMISSIGRAVGASFSTPLWEWGGIYANTLIAALLTLIAAGVCAVFVRETEATEHHSV